MWGLSYIFLQFKYGIVSAVMSTVLLCFCSITLLLGPTAPLTITYLVIHQTQTLAICPIMTPCRQSDGEYTVSVVSYTCSLCPNLCKSKNKLLWVTNWYIFCWIWIRLWEMIFACDHWPNVGLMLGQHQRLWANINPTLDQRPMFSELIENVL